ncbi:exodeoxyribonuclease VII small subunit [Acuticoccus sediminis]|uniref:Exodeoxyribonuclease 7 small subunit n=1 Tax=Acuticoccus sediminis TaxID=2184697 RepID=A0A8B2NMY6_9HYPH|nr:exodeoxyribonuclease VII small subunit [Acuticoccus sediminis]
MSEANRPDVATMTFEAAMGELEAIVDKLEKGNVPLEESIAYYERGEALKTRCDALLKNAEMRVEKVRLKASGEPSGTEPLDKSERPSAPASAPAPVDDDIPF